MDGFSNTIQKKVRSSAQTMAKQVAKTVKEEREGYAKAAKTLIAGGETGASKQSLVEGGVSGAVGESESLDGDRQDREISARRIQELEAELRSAASERREKEEKWKQEQEAGMQSEEKGEGKETVIVLPSSPRKGPVGPGGPGGRGMKGTGEMVKSRK